MVKQKVTVVKDLAAILGDMEPWVKNPQILYTGRSGNFKLLPREILANWLICAVGNSFAANKPLTFCNDPFGGGDGIIIDRENGDQMVTEHVFVPKHRKQGAKSAEELIIEAVEKKQKKGCKAYAEGKHLVIFCDGIGEWYPNKVGREIQGEHDFSSVWALGLQKVENENLYSYWVACFDKSHTPAYQVKINFKEKKWLVDLIQ